MLVVTHACRHAARTRDCLYCLRSVCAREAPWAMLGRCHGLPSTEERSAYRTRQRISWCGAAAGALPPRVRAVMRHDSFIEGHNQRAESRPTSDNPPSVGGSHHSPLALEWALGWDASCSWSSWTATPEGRTHIGLTPAHAPYAWLCAGVSPTA